MNVTIIGGGNIGTYFAIEFSKKGHEVMIYSSRADEFSKELEMIGATEEILSTAQIAGATDNLEKAVEKAEFIIITLPAFMLEEIASQLYPIVKSGICIGIIPGTGGVEFYFKYFAKKEVTVFGLQRAPAVARLVQYGQRVRVKGKRQKLFLAAFPNGKAEAVAEVISDVFEMPCECLDNYLCVTLTPSNSLLHTSRLHSLFSDYYDGKIYSSVPLFYKEWDDDSSEMLLLCDAELQDICHALKNLNMESVRSLKIHYESNTIKEMTSKIRSIESLQGIKTPMLRQGDGYIPEFESRYFMADFPYGLAVIKQVADLAKVEVNSMNTLLKWYEEKVPNARKSVDLGRYGVNSLDDLIAIYQ